jgi:uncharacterized protein (TIGR03435 family)
MSLIGSMEKDLGIKVDKQTRPADALIVESVNETPSPNPPGTAEKLPPQVTEFEVIEVHASKPGSEQRVDIKNGRLEAIGVSLKEMIGFAYNLDSYMLPNLEKWVETDRFDLIGKTDPVITDGTLMAMVQSLLVTQFHMKSHFTEQDVSVWALTAPKGEGKLKPAAGADRVGCVRAPKDGALTYVCQPHR